MATYANQKTIIINKEKVNELNERVSYRGYQDNMLKAMRELGGSTFKIFMILVSYKHQYRFDYSPVYFSKISGLSESSCQRAFSELQEKGYLVPIKENSSIYNFYETENITQSKGEENILELLKKHNFKFLYDEPYFKDCMGDKFPLRFDFILFTDDDVPWRLIEFDGPQHESNTFNDEEAFNKLQRYDKIKNEYALSHNLPLIRIPYSEKDNITIELLMGNKYLVNK